MSTSAAEDTEAEGGAETETEEGGQEGATEGGAEGAEPGPSRAEKRKARAAGFKEELRQRDELIASERAQRERIDRELAEMRGRLAERAEANPQKDPREKQIEDIDAEANRLLQLAASHAEKNPAEAQRLVNEHTKLQRKAAALQARMDIEAEAREAQRGRPAPLPPAVQMDIQRVATEHPWLASDDAARAMTDSLIGRMVAGGAPNTYATFKAAATRVAATLGIGGTTQPTERQRGAYAGVGAGEGAGGGGDDGGTARVDPDTERHQRALAQALANRRGTGKSGKEAKADWDKEVGSRIRKRAE